MRFAAVLALERVQQQRAVLEHVDVLHVVPVRVGEHHLVDVARGQPAPAERVLQEGPPAHLQDLDRGQRRWHSVSLLSVLVSGVVRRYGSASLTRSHHGSAAWVSRGGTVAAPPHMKSRPGPLRRNAAGLPASPAEIAVSLAR